jgi:preprotein translocase subunit SecF
MILTGMGVLAGQVWARALAVVLAGIAALVNFLFIPVYPLWSIIAMVIDIVVIYALMAHGYETEVEVTT